MNEATIYGNWALARQALNETFPGYDYPLVAPPEATFRDALEGLAIANQLTLNEVIETVLDKMMMLGLSNETAAQQSAA